MFFLLALFSLVRSEEPPLNGAEVAQERRRSMEEWKRELERFRETKRNLISQMKETKMKLNEARKNGEDITNLSKELDTIREKLQQADEEFRESRNKHFDREAGERRHHGIPDFKKHPIKRFDREELEQEIRAKREQIAKKLHGPHHDEPQKLEE